MFSIFTDPKFFILFIFYPLVYAETHYRFKYFFSWISKPEPEIIIDVPYRIKKGKRLPILIVIKDAHLFPVKILDLQIRKDEQDIFSYKINRLISNSFQEIILNIDTTKFEIGMVYIDCIVQYSVKNKIKFCKNDNHRGTSHKAFPVNISGSELPRLPGCLYGDAHTHTSYTSDQVEFGASLPATVEMAKAINIDYFCATDHSYDLDDQVDNYLVNDPYLKKWELFKSEIKKYEEQKNEITIIPGEEVTLRNHKGKNVHCLIYNSNKFYPGSGDSAEKWFRTKSELCIEELLEEVEEEDNVLIFAAHPSEKPPLLQRLFISRDTWKEIDCYNNRLNGIQFINGGNKRSIEIGKKFWIKLLLKGKRSIGLAGNDAHGNFCRFRQVGLPFFTMREHYNHIFGTWRTGVYVDNQKISPKNILSSFKAGKSFMTTGPALKLMVLANDSWHHSGGIFTNIKKLKIEAKSSVEFSPLHNLKIYLGKKEGSHEDVTVEKILTNKPFYFISEFEIKLTAEGYIRVEISTETGFHALSNPVWFRT
jgi:hypothetical protein